MADAHALGDAVAEARHSAWQRGSRVGATAPQSGRAGRTGRSSPCWFSRRCSRRFWRPTTRTPSRWTRGCSRLTAPPAGHGRARARHPVAAVVRRAGIAVGGHRDRGAVGPDRHQRRTGGRATWAATGMRSSCAWWTSSWRFRSSSWRLPSSPFGPGTDQRADCAGAGVLDDLCSRRARASS